ncbi:fungal-specific transcription factor domain-containing protein [Podospora australis]|uniref:Fungal-specific transcription factor domain-containing protein n=1 Tax=Podospora australis TaxID=1536484 RepID=A0AAN6X0K8_9PEZI|nr:fungal-specific transcription factor domain-containing protein [Podospora australis]
MKERSNMSALFKEHKWVNNHGQPPSKRRRINAACLTCRKRKTRCAGEKPVCSTCAKNGHRCMGYNETEEKKSEERDVSTASKGFREVNIKLEIEREEDHLGGLANTDVKQERHDRHTWHKDEFAQEDDTGYQQSWDEKSSKQQPVAGFVDAGSLSRQDSVLSATITSGASSLRRKHSDESNEGNQSTGPGSAAKRHKAQDSRTENDKSTVDQPSAGHQQQQQHQDEHENHRVPYFRYFGPTAIVPGHKQMLVDRPLNQRERRKSRGESFSTTSAAPELSSESAFGQQKAQLQQIQLDNELHTLSEVHPYDMDDDVPPHELIIVLVSTFFKNLGSDFRFLKEKRTMRLLKEKRLEPILVDAMCALAARFLDLPVLKNDQDGKKKRAEYGYVFAQRAKAGTVDTFPCPSVAAVQACLLMAYEGFGANQDSSLWMYLGLAIRMAVDLGLQKTEGVKFKDEHDPWYTRTWNRNNHGESHRHGESDHRGDKNGLSPQERSVIEQERIDTFWAVFILDRVISSGTGRPVSFRDTDFDLAFPQKRWLPGPNNLLDPFPVFVEVINLYGQASDILNNIQSIEEGTLAKLRVMEQTLQALYEREPELLHFNPVHFQLYHALGLGATFLLLHFWFHALIIILHQPTMLTEKWNANPVQLNADSRELAISSAKSITDILSISGMISFSSFFGNPFTSQPIYIAACAFLLESRSLKSGPPSRAQSPLPNWNHPLFARIPRAMAEVRATQPSFLAHIVNQNYQRCYDALLLLRSYWGGIGYIITALDQKSKGIWDCETFVRAEYEEMLARKRAGPLSRLSRLELPASPSLQPPNLEPIAYSLTGTTNSPNSNLTVLFQTPATAQQQVQAPLHQTSAPVSTPTTPGTMRYDPIRADTQTMLPPYPQPNISAVRNQPHASQLSSSFRSTPVGGKPLPKYDSPSSGDMEQQQSPGSHFRHDTYNNGMSYSPSAHNHLSYASETSQDESPLSGMPLASVDSHSSGSSGSSNEPDNNSNNNSNYHHQADGDQNHSSNDNYGSGDYVYSNEYDHEFSQPGLIQMNGPYYNAAFITDNIAINTQEVNFDMFGLGTDTMPAWLEIVPEVVGGLFDGSVLGMHHYHM